MNTSQLHKLAAVLMVGGALAACDREGMESPATPSSSSAELSPRVQDLPPPAGTTPIPPQVPPPSAESHSGTAPDGPAAAPRPSAGEGAAADKDRAFVATVAARGQAEVEAGRLVAREGRSPQVKDFADQFQREHAALNERLARLAATKKLQVTEAMPETARADLAELHKVSGAELDALFLSRFGIAAHRESIDLFEQQAREGSDPDLRAFARESVVMLRKHEETARSLQQKLANEPR